MRFNIPFLQKLMPWVGGETPVALVMVITGAYVAREAFWNLKGVWAIAAGYFPLSVPPDAGARLLACLPWVTGLFVSTVGSAAAILIGLGWAIAGLADFFRAAVKVDKPEDFQHPELVAETIRTGRPQQWRAVGFVGRGMAALVPWLKRITPISSTMIGELLRACIKLAVVAVLIGLALHLIRQVPALVRQYLQVEFSLTVPSAQPLYVVLGVLALVNVVTAAGLLPFRRRIMSLRDGSVMVRGRGEAAGFFALLEEGCKLLAPKGAQSRSPIRLEQSEDPLSVATLIEVAPQVVAGFARPVAYVWLPLVFLMVSAGFSRLIHFQRPEISVPYQQFVSGYLVTYIFEAAFALALILAGLSVCERARRLCRLRKYRSALVFCYVTRTSADASGTSQAALTSVESEGLTWQLAEGADERFARWVRNPQIAGSFTVRVLWAEAVSESATDASPRILAALHNSPSLDAAMAHILRVPLHVSYEAESAWLAEMEPSEPSS